MAVQGYAGAMMASCSFSPVTSDDRFKPRSQWQVVSFAFPQVSPAEKSE